MSPEPGDVPVHEGPDPKDWPDAAPQMWAAVLNIEALHRVSAAIGPWMQDEDERAMGGAREFVQNALRNQKAELAEMILHAYRVQLPEEPEQATEAVGGFSGDGDGPGDRDHMRPVQ